MEASTLSSSATAVPVVNMISEISIALVREYLKRCGYDRTLATLDFERPRTAASIGRRTELVRRLHLEKLYRRNKATSSPLGSMVEIIVQHHMSESAALTTKKSSTSMASNEFDIGGINGKESEPLAVSPERTKRTKKNKKNGSTSGEQQPDVSHVIDHERDELTFEKKKAASMKNYPLSQQASLSLSPLPMKPKQQYNNRVSIEKEQAEKKEEAYPYRQSRESLSRLVSPLMSDLNGKNGSTKPSDVGTDELCFEDVSFDEENFSSSQPNRYIPEPIGGGSQAIDLDTASLLKKIIFGNAMQSFSPEWRKQNFLFSDEKDVGYGLIQHRGGPCGILAVVQAFILRYLLFDGGCEVSERFRRPTVADQRAALVQSIATILFDSAGSGRRCMVTVPHTQGQAAFTCISTKFKADNLTETLVLHIFSSRERLVGFLSNRTTLDWFTGTNQPGAILLLYSAILSRGVGKVRTDMDEPSGRLLGAHRYCTQEMVNLLMVGVACSNVHDGDISVGGDSAITLKGIPHHSTIGFLSLFEHYGSCVVGAHLKQPKFPIFVVVSESHYTVLFSEDRNIMSQWQTHDHFDLIYYDQLANQAEEILLTIDTVNEVDDFFDPDDKALVPPLEHCIRTCWPRCRVDWNNTDPLL